MFNTGCLVISSFQIPGHFQVLQDSFSKSYMKQKKLNTLSFYTLLFTYIKIFFMIFYCGKNYSTKTIQEP